MAKTRDKKLTIHLNDSITPELMDWLKENGDSAGGRKLLRMGYLLEKSGLADQIMLLASQKGMAAASQFELVEKAVELLKPLQQMMQPVPQTTAKQAPAAPVQKPQPATTTADKKPSVFSAGRVQQ